MSRFPPGAGKKPPLAPGARLPLVLAYVAMLFGENILRVVGIERSRAFGLHFWASWGTFAVLGFIALRIHRRWLREQGYTQPKVKRSTPPEIWIGIGVLVVGFAATYLLGRTTVAAGVTLALTFITAVALVVVASMKEPARKAADEEAHRATWEQPFD